MSFIKLQSSVISSGKFPETYEKMFSFLALLNLFSITMLFAFPKLMRSSSDPKNKDFINFSALNIYFFSIFLRKASLILWTNGAKKQLRT